MSTTRALLSEYRRRLSRILRQAETRADRAASILREGYEALIADLRVLGATEPVAAGEILVTALEELAVALASCNDDQGHAGALPLLCLDALRDACLRITKEAKDQDAFVLLATRTFDVWNRDRRMDFTSIPLLLMSLSREDQARPGVIALLGERLRGGILYFPLRKDGKGDGEGDIERAEALEKRRAAEHLFGEVLALEGRTEYAVLVAKEEARRTGHVLGLVTALARHGQPGLAIQAARRALGNPSVPQRERLIDLLEELQSKEPRTWSKDRRRKLERAFLDDPSAAAFEAVRESLPPEQWDRAARRLLGFLQKHQRAPSLVFRLWLRLGDLQEADALAATQPVAAEVLEEEAGFRIETEPGLAAGWLLVAAHRRADAGGPGAPAAIARNLLTVRELAGRTGQARGFATAVARFRERHHDREDLLQILAESGI